MKLIRVSAYSACLVCGFIATAFAVTEPLQPNDFAYGVHLQPQHDRALQSLRLPLDYYRNGSGEVRIFSADNLTLPIDFVPIQAAQTLQALALYPLSEQSERLVDSLQLEVMRNEQAMVINLMDRVRSGVQDEQTVAYLVSLSDAQIKQYKSVNQLAFEWTQPEQGFITQLSIDRSDDLQHWQPWIVDETLSRLQAANQQIGKSTIDISVAQAKQIGRYWRIRWHDATPFVLSSLKMRQSTDQAHGDQQWQSLAGAWRPDPKNPNAFEFDTQGTLPISAIEIAPKQDNALFAGQIYSRTTAELPWVSRGDFNQYRLEHNQQRLLSEPHRLANIRDPYWRLEFTPPFDAALFLSANSRYGWTPERLIFMRQGESPYTLAWGNPQVKRIQSDFSFMISRLDEAGRDETQRHPVLISKMFELGGKSQLLVQAPINWRDWILWGALTLAVAVLLFMARRLYGQLKTQ